MTVLLGSMNRAEVLPPLVLTIFCSNLRLKLSNLALASRGQYFAENFARLDIDFWC